MCQIFFLEDEGMTHGKFDQSRYSSSVHPQLIATHQSLLSIINKVSALLSVHNDKMFTYG